MALVQNRRPSYIGKIDTNDDNYTLNLRSLVLFQVYKAAKADQKEVSLYVPETLNVHTCN